MTTADPTLRPQKSLLGEVLTHVTGIKYHTTSVKAGEVVLLEREPANFHDPHAIRIKNTSETAIGYLPRSVACWLAPLLDAQKVRIEGYFPSRPGVSHGVKTPTLPVVLSVFVAGQAEDFLEMKEIRTKKDVLHQVFYQAYQQAHEFTVKELADELSVSEKTIRRDLETFQTAGFPLEETVEDFGRKKWKLETGANPPAICLLWDEAAALYMGQRFLEPLAGTPFWEAAQRAFKKIRATLGDGSLKYMEKFSSLFHKTMVGVSDYSKKAEIVDQLMLGIEEARAVFITYQSLKATEPVTYDVYPYCRMNPLKMY